MNYRKTDAPRFDRNGDVDCSGCEGCKHRQSKLRNTVDRKGAALCPRLSVQIAVGITYADGDRIIARFDGTEEEAVRYYESCPLQGTPVAELLFLYTGHEHHYLSKSRILLFHINKELKRVPLGFDWPIGKTWFGYLFEFCNKDEDTDYCSDCRKFAQLKGMSSNSDTGCPDFGLGPPSGPGYQLWETATSKGSPYSPVFEKLDDLCDWCEGNAYTFALERYSAEQWKMFFEGQDGLKTVNR